MISECHQFRTQISQCAVDQPSSAFPVPDFPRITKMPTKVTHVPPRVTNPADHCDVDKRVSFRHQKT